MNTYLFIFILLSAIIIFFFLARNEYIENFDDYSNFILKDSPNKIFDEFYANIYDKLFKNKKYLPDIIPIKKFTIDNNNHFAKSDIKFLDLGCGTGNNIKALQQLDIKCVGVDNSINMLERARSKSDCKLIKADFNKKHIFQKNSFTHILGLQHSIYYVQNIENFFKNINYWLKLRGFFCIQLIDTSISKKKMKKKMDQYYYLSHWSNTNHFKENFLFSDKSKHIQHDHNFNINPIISYIQLAKKTGFSFYKKYKTPEKDYIYIFKKKYNLY